METNHDGEIGHPCSGHAVTCLEGVSRIWDVRVRTNIVRNSDRRPAIDLAALVTIDRLATRGLRAQFNTERVPDVPMRTDPREAIGIQAVPATRVTLGLKAPTLRLEIISTLAA
jgi:hypothetical protein